MCILFSTNLKKELVYLNYGSYFFEKNKKYIFRIFFNIEEKGNSRFVFLEIMKVFDKETEIVYHNSNFFIQQVLEYKDIPYKVDKVLVFKVLDK